MNDIDLTIPTRQSLKGLVFIYMIALQKLARASWPLILVYVFQDKNYDKLMVFAIGAGVVLLLLLVHSILYYLHFYFLCA